MVGLSCNTTSTPIGHFEIDRNYFLNFSLCSVKRLYHYYIMVFSSTSMYYLFCCCRCWKCSGYVFFLIIGKALYSASQEYLITIKRGLLVLPLRSPVTPEGVVGAPTFWAVHDLPSVFAVVCRSSGVGQRFLGDHYVACLGRINLAVTNFFQDMSSSSVAWSRTPGRCSSSVETFRPNRWHESRTSVPRWCRVKTTPLSLAC